MDEQLKRYEEIEQRHLQEEQVIINDMSHMTCILKENSLHIRDIVRNDTKKIEKIEKVSEKQHAQMIKEK